MIWDKKRDFGVPERDFWAQNRDLGVQKRDFEAQNGPYRIYNKI